MSLLYYVRAVGIFDGRISWWRACVSLACWSYDTAHCSQSL